MRNCIAAYTISGFDPPFFNVTEEDDAVILTVRGKMDERTKCSVCGFVPHGQPYAAIKLTKAEWETIKRQINGVEHP